MLVDFLEKIWDPIFIHDSYACRKGKGVHAGVKRLCSFIRQATANGTRAARYLQLDIRDYFMSIDKQVLFDLLAAGRSVTLIGKTGRFGDGVKERAPRCRFESTACRG